MGDRYGAWGIAPRLVRNPFKVGLCKTEAQFFASLRRLKVPKDEWPSFLMSPQASATVHRLTSSNLSADPVIIVCIRPEKRSRTETDGLLIHESVHIWQWAKAYYAEDCPSMEFEAYAIQNIAQGLIEAYHGS